MSYRKHSRYNSRFLIKNQNMSNDFTSLSFGYATSPRWSEYSDWMSKLSDNYKNIPLYKLGLPGTHDSGTYELFTDEIYNVNDFTGIAPTIAGPIIRAMAVTQNADIYTQLMEGNRYIDLRFAKDNKGRIRIVHTVFGLDAQTIFEQIKRFLLDHPTEVVVIDIQNINNLNTNDENILRNIIKQQIGDFLAPRNSFSPSSTLNDFNLSNKNGILIYQNANFINTEPLYWYRNDFIIQNPWYNTNNINYLIQSNDISLLKLPKERKFIFVSQMVLTINNSQILDIILNLLKWLPVPIYGEIRFVEEFNKLVNTPGIYNLTAPNYDRIQEWIDRHRPNNPLNSNVDPNIIILDFYRKINITSIINYNTVYN